MFFDRLDKRQSFNHLQPEIFFGTRGAKRLKILLIRYFSVLNLGFELISNRTTGIIILWRKNDKNKQTQISTQKAQPFFIF